MKFKGTLFLLVVFLALLGYVLFFNKGEKKHKSSKLFHIKKSNIVEIKIKKGKNEVVLKKVNKRWDLEKPIETSADYDKLQEMERSLKKMLYERVVDENCKDFKRYGLVGNNATEVAFKDANGKEYKFFIGDKNPSGDYRYLRKKSDKRVYLVYGFDLEKFKPDVEFLRDKTLAYVNLTDMTDFSLKRNGEDFFFKKEHFNWYMKRPFYARMDDEKIRDMLKKVEFDKVYKNIDEKKDFSKFFKDPMISLVMNYENGDKSVLEISKKNPFKKYPDKYFGRNVETNRYFLLKKDVVEKLSTPLADLRSKDLVEFYPFEVSGITLKNSENTLILKKKDDSTWILKVGDRQEDVKNDRVMDYLGKIRDMKVDGFIDPPLDLAKFGVENSGVSFILDIKKDSRSSGLKLSFGNSNKNYVFVKNSLYPYLMKLKKEEFNKIFVKDDFFKKGGKK